jgi:hypothetical protein
MSRIAPSSVLNVAYESAEESHLSFNGAPEPAIRFRGAAEHHKDHFAWVEDVTFRLSELQGFGACARAALGYASGYYHWRERWLDRWYRATEVRLLVVSLAVWWIRPRRPEWKPLCSGLAVWKACRAFVAAPQGVPPGTDKTDRR